ncbi:MAG: nuclear transport factor 2 family protein [Woeseiaceae bacterium]
MQRITIISLVLVSTAAMADLADDVRCREIGFSKSIESRDMEAFRSFLDDDARFVGGQVRRGPDEITEGWSVYAPADGPSLKWRPQIVEVLEDGKLALSRGPYKYTEVNAEGDVVDYYGTFNSIWRLQDDGSWKIVFDAGSLAAGKLPEDQLVLLEAEDDCDP